MMTVQEKQNIMTHLRQLMEQDRLHIPYDPDLINEMNAEQFEYTKTGQTLFSHSSGTHDDRLWALALAGYAARFEIPTYHPSAAVSGKPNSHSYMPNLPRKLWKM